MANQFKATLNGTSFNDLHEYASALERVIKEGGNIETQFSINSSSIESADECNTNEKKKLKSIKKYLPFSDEILSCEYIDFIFNAPGNETRSQRIDHIEWGNKQLYHEIREAVSHNSDEQLKTYLEDVERVLDKLEIDDSNLENGSYFIENDYETAIENYEQAKNKLRETEEALNIERERWHKYKDAIKLTNTLAYFYRCVRAHIREELSLRN